jgi:DNA repair protein RadC
MKNSLEKFSGRICDLAEADKPREKALAKGVESLSNTELLAIILGSGQHGKSVIHLAQEILAKCDQKLSHLSRMTITELIRDINGIGPAKAISLYAAIEFGCRCQNSLNEVDPQLTSSEAIYQLMRPRLERLNHEEFWLLVLNHSNRLKQQYLISQGGMACTVVDPKILFKKAIDLQANTIVIVHNHPSGQCSPSHEDNKLTHKIIEGASLLDIHVLDHLIISHTGYYSYHDNNQLI